MCKNKISILNTIAIGIILLVFLNSCINYLPCRGQDYIIEDITSKELINKFEKFKETNPKYYADKDHINKDIPHYYINLYMNDLKLTFGLDIHIGKELKNPPTHLNFTHIKNISDKYLDINSKEINKNLNENIKLQFEKDILDKLNIKWKRIECL